VTAPGKRSFWLHQAAEYLIGAVFVAQGLQSPTPIVPSVLGGFIMLNAACTKGSLSAFRLIGRRMHRILDAVIIGLILVACIQPWISIDNSTRLIMAMLAFVLGFVWWQSDFTEKAPATRPAAPPSTSEPAPIADPGPDGSRPDTIGRAAGRLAGKGVNAYRARRDQLKR
jgi:hypothetical protein